jgi:integrase/recombinase XerD
VRFSEISVSWLNQFEHYCYSRELSKTTVGIHTRALRTIFNEADAEGIIQKSKLYPFGRRKYVIPKGRNIKKAYSLEQIEKIFTYQPANDYERRSHAYWKFLYLANGMNSKDAALLKYKNIEDGFIVFERAKTIRTGRADTKIISVYITEEMK